jgi:hypothetical protein
VGSLLSSHETGRFAGPDRIYARSVQTRGTLGVAFVGLVAANAVGAWWTRRRGHPFEAALCGAVTLSAVLAFLSAMTARGNPSHHIVMFAAGIGLTAWLGLALVAAAAIDELILPWARRSDLRPLRAGVELAASVAGRVAGSRRWRGAGAVGVALVVMAVTVPLVRRPVVLVDPVGPDVDALAALIDPLPGERIVVDTDRFGDGLLLWVVIRLAVDGNDVRVRDKWRVQVTGEQAMPPTWDRSVYLDPPGGARPGAGSGWHELGQVRLFSGRDVRVLARPGHRK